MTHVPHLLTYLKIRRLVAEMVGDYYEGTATSTGTTTTTTDANNTYPTNHWRGAEIWLPTSGANGAPVVRRISASTSEGIITHGTVNNAVESGETYEIHNIGGRGWRVSTKRNAIDAAVFDVINNLYEHHVDEATKLEALKYEYAVPLDFTHIHTVMVRDFTNEWVPLRPYSWQLIPYTVLQLASWVPDNYHGQKLRIVGYKNVTDPSTLDDDAWEDRTCPVDAHFVAYRAAATLLASRPEEASRSARFDTLAEARRPFVRTVFKPNTRRVV